MIKRSVVNQTITDAIAFFKANNVSLPPFAYWTKDDFVKNYNYITGIIKGKLGWDVTDFGQEDFTKFGRTIFTLRNGYIDKGKLTQPYAQKVMFLRDNQKSTIHYHISKIEDIINVAGGQIVVKLWHKTQTNTLAEDKVMARIDGLAAEFKPGVEIIIKPGESVNIPSGTFHQFWAKENSGHVASMEVSSINDDTNDNVWLDSGTRYPKIEEDSPRKFVLCYEYNLLTTPAK